MIWVALAFVLSGLCLAAALAGYGLGREEVIQSYEDEIAEQRVIDSLLPAGFRIVER